MTDIINELNWKVTACRTIGTPKVFGEAYGYIEACWDLGAITEKTYDEYNSKVKEIEYWINTYGKGVS